MNKETIYTIDYFINKFKNINSSLWIMGRFSEGDKKCAGGHCGMNDCIGYRTDEFRALLDLTDVIQLTHTNTNLANVKFSNVVAVNDGLTLEYNQPNPKERVLALLNGIKKITDPEPIPEPKVKEVIRYVSVPTTVTEQAKELINHQN